MIVFNHDMDLRLADLQTHLDGDRALKIERHAKFDHLPERLVIDLAPPRRIVLALEFAGAVADQLALNGHKDAADQIRAAMQ